MKHFKVEMWNKDASRVAFHLSGDVGLHDTGNGLNGIGICLQVPSNVANRTQIDMAANTAKKARKSDLGVAGQVTASEEGDSRAERKQGTLPHFTGVIGIWCCACRD